MSIAQALFQRKLSKVIAKEIAKDPSFKDRVDDVKEVVNTVKDVIKKQKEEKKNP